MSLVSIVIPSYNRSNLIAETLGSVLAQTYQNWECIVVDDGSTDDTRDIVWGYVSRDSRFSFYKRPIIKRKGANSCRNFGFEKSLGDYILFLDSDDLLVATCIENRVECFKKNKELDFIIANTAAYKSGVFSKLPLCTLPNNTAVEAYLQYFLKYKLPWISTLSVLWKRDVIEKVNFDESLMRFQDIDFHIRILLNSNLACYRINEIDNYYRIEERDIKLSPDFAAKTLNAYLVFFKKHNKLLLAHETYREPYKIFNCKMILEFLIPFFRGNRRVSKSILVFCLKSKLYTFTQKGYIALLLFFLTTNVFYVQGLGMNAFRRLFKSKILK